MAAAGIRFDRFYSAHPMCSPTRASCLSGRSPVRYRCMTWGHDLPLREVTIAEAVRTAGYATGHFGKWHVGGIPHADGGTGRGLPESFCPQPRHPGNQGFDEWKQYEWEGGCEDLHIIEDEDGTYYMNYTTWSGRRDTMSVATSRDLRHWTKHGPAFRKHAPEKVFGSRSGVVVSRRQGDRLIAANLDGKYWMYYTHPCGIAWSDNLIDWV